MAGIVLKTSHCYLLILVPISWIWILTPDSFSGQTRKRMTWHVILITNHPLTKFTNLSLHVCVIFAYFLCNIRCRVASLPYDFYKPWVQQGVGNRLHLGVSLKHAVCRKSSVNSFGWFYKPKRSINRNGNCLNDLNLRGPSAYCLCTIPHTKC